MIGFGSIDIDGEEAGLIRKLTESMHRINFINLLSEQILRFCLFHRLPTRANRA